MGRFADIATAIAQAQAMERQWQQLRGSRPADPRTTGWMPYDLFDYAGLVFEAIPVIPAPAPDKPPRILHVGAGPGSKMIIDRDVFGLDPYGIEIDPAMAGAAAAAGLLVLTADAATWAGYADADCIWLNRPLRDPAAESALERKIWREMAPGAVIICAHLESPPPAEWIIVLDDWESGRRGAWVKPYPVPDLS